MVLLFQYLLTRTYKNYYSRCTETVFKFHSKKNINTNNNYADFIFHLCNTHKDKRQR